MRSLVQAIRQLPAGKRAIIVAAILIIVLTWLGVCAILATYPIFSL